MNLKSFPNFVLRLCASSALVATLVFHVATNSARGQSTQSQSVQGQSTWSQFRGPNNAGSVERCNVPLPWKDSDIKWKVNLAGKGNASPIIWSNTAYLVSSNTEANQRVLQAIDIRSGKQTWSKTFELTQHKVHQKNGFATGTPCADENGVYLAYGDPQLVKLVALSHGGEKLWEKELGSFVGQHGFGASPVVHQGTVILWISQDAEQLPPGQAPGDSRILAFDAKTGQPKWNTSRIATRTCYGTPTLFQADSGPALMFANTAEGFFALDLATGKPLWNRQAFTQRSVSCPMIVGDIAIATEGAGSGKNALFAVSMRGDHERLFTLDKNIPYVPTPVVKGNLVFLWSDKGIVSCMSLPKGEILWSERVGGNVFSSPVIIGDKLVGTAEDGTVTVLSASSTFKNIGSISLGEDTRATPAITENYILIRTESKLICVGNPT